MEYSFKIPNGININDFINNSYLCMNITSVKGDLPNFTEQNIKGMFDVSIVNTDDNNNINIDDNKSIKEKYKEKLMIMKNKRKPKK